ncbi:MAG TPA: aminotransferase class V-fold PLP-dependent enzyme, partial [Thermoleophilaceae bacterium]|nr:aminotransferase class V-fold PLP-dependent enzyme [Thermoleophilaceae bacterium]
ARAAVGELLGGDPRGAVFGPSMTTLTLSFAAAVGRELSEGDEIVCTRIDHDANVAPWLIAAERGGAVVRFAEPPDRQTLELPPSAFEAVLSDRTHWVAVTAASNAVGTAPDIGAIASLAHDAGARVYVDAVHATPHRRMDVAALGVDALSCSAYKWFGPHGSILWARPELLEELKPDKLRPSSDEVPWRWETGTPAFESLAGIVAAARYLMETGFEAIRAHEDALMARMLGGLGGIAGVTLYGAAADRTPTAMFNVAGRSARDVARALADEKVAVWHGNYYALELSRFLDLEPDGAVRAGLVHYNDESDVDRLLDVVSRLAA